MKLFYSIRGLLIISCLLLSSLAFSKAGYMMVKAQLAQHLLEQAWQTTQTDSQINNKQNGKIKPWPWADIYPVAKLGFPQSGASYIVLNTDSGQALAFGPGLSGLSALETYNAETNDQNERVEQINSGVSVISAHRDSHFKLLENIKEGEEITFELISGDIQHYNVTKVYIIDIRTDELHVNLNENSFQEGLVLITCYPFNNASISTPYRLIVEAS